LLWVCPVFSIAGSGPIPPRQTPESWTRPLEKQLGLKLVKVKDVPVDMLVIDHAEKVPLGD